jgi:ABC-type dipeptide/oligopeptide/nickel transport system ATPase component
MHLDKVDMHSARSRKEFAREVTRIFREPADLVEADVAKLLAACERRVAMLNPPGTPAPAPGTIPEADRKIGEAFGRDPKLISIILADYERFGLVGERTNKLLSYLTMTSRKLRRPLALLIVSSSGSGKSALQDVTVKFCPSEGVEKITNLSEKALYHKERDSLKGKLVAFEEASGIKKADYPLRVFISAGELTTEVAIKDSTTGKLTTMRNRVEGPIAVMVTDTSLALNPETISRFIITSVDDSKEQTRAIMEIQRREETLEGLVAEQGNDEILRRHHAFQRLLQPLRVVNPISSEVEFEDDRLSARRELPKRFRLIQAVAFLRQLQKPVKYAGAIAYIEVDKTDLKIARELTDELLGHGVAELSPMAHGLLLQLVRMRDAQPKAAASVPDREQEPLVFTCRQVREFTGAPNSSLQRHLKELCGFEYIVQESGRRGLTCRYRLDWDAS